MALPISLISAAMLVHSCISAHSTGRRRKATAAPPSENHRLARWRSIDLDKVHQINRDEVSRLLNKIETQGVSSLNGQERTFLAGFIPPEEAEAATGD